MLTDEICLDVKALNLFYVCMLWLVSCRTHQSLYCYEACAVVMVAHGRVVTSPDQITEVKQRGAQLVLGWATSARVTLPAMCRGVGQAFHIMPPLSTQQWWVPGGMKNGELWMALAAENALDFPQKRWDHIREFQYQGCKLWSLLNAMGCQTINIHICILYLWTYAFDCEDTQVPRSVHSGKFVGKWRGNSIITITTVGFPGNLLGLPSKFMLTNSFSCFWKMLGRCVMMLREHIIQSHGFTAGFYFSMFVLSCFSFLFWIYCVFLSPSGKERLIWDQAESHRRGEEGSRCDLQCYIQAAAVPRRGREEDCRGSHRLVWFQ